MTVFIPAWYGDRNYLNSMIPWFRQQETIQFDEISNFIKIYHDEEQEVSILSLNYLPNRHYFCHAKDILEVNHWNAFDYLQGIKTDRVKPFQYQDLPWPEGVEFVYTPFLVMCYLKNKRYANIHFGNDGNVIWIDYFNESDVIDKRHIYDDRGFISSKIYFDEPNQIHHQDFYNEHRQLQFTVHASGIIEVYAARDHLKKKYYTKMDELLLEVLSHYRRIVWDYSPIFYTSSIHDEILETMFDDKRNIVSLWQQQPSTIDTKNMYLAYNKNMFLNVRNSQGDVIEITPFNTLFQLGHSNNIYEKKVVVYLDGFKGDIQELFSILVSLLDRIPSLYVSFLSFGQHSISSQDADILQTMIDQYNQSLNEESEFDVEDEVIREEIIRMDWKIIHHEIDIYPTLEDARVLVDLGKEPNLFLEIAGISVGIPQIHSGMSEFVEDKKNGYIIHDLNELEDSILYFVAGLNNWNQSLVYCVQKQQMYSSDTIVETIEEGYAS